MAKKVAVPDEETVEENGGIKAKKKRNCCCTCCLVVLIVVLVIFLAAFIVGWILGDKYTQELFGMSMGDTVGVVNDLYWTDDDDVVTHPFSQNDLNGFYSEIKRNILLKDDVEVKFDDALDKAIDKYLGGDTTAQTLNAGSEGEGNSEESDSEIMDILVNMISDVLDRDNIDLERLNKYDANNPESDEYIFNLNDKQLAAFINTVLNKVLKNASKMDSLKDISEFGISIDKIVALKQIRFTARQSKDENGKDEIKASSAEITVWLGLQEAANQAIKKAMSDLGQGWAGGIVGWIGNVILPENIYLTVSIPLMGENNKAFIKINDMDDEERARANKLINGIFKQMSDDGKANTLDDVIDDLLKEIKPILEEAAEKMDFTNASSGTISMDLLDTVAKMASEEMESPLTKSDFLYVLQALFSDSSKQLNSLQPFRYDNWYMVDGKPVFMTSGGKAEDKIDYEQEFIKEIGNKYAIKFEDGTTLTDVLKMLGISLDGGESGSESTDLLNKVDGDKFNALLDKNINDIKLNVTDRMLGAALSNQMKDIVQDSDLSGLEMKLEALTFVEKAAAKANGNDHLYALLAVNVKLSGLLDSLGGDGDSLMTKLATGLMPDSILLTMTVDITRDRSVTRDKAEFIINSCDNTDHILEILEKLVPDFKLTDISDQVADTLNNMLDEIDGQIKIELTPTTYEFDEEIDGWLGNSGALVMPDIFTVVTDMVLVKDGDSIVTPAQLKDVIRDLNNPAETEGKTPKDGCEAFIGQVFDKYYLEAPAKKITTLDGLTDYMTNDFSTSNLKVDGSDGLAHDKRAMDDLCPVMTSEELFALLKDKIKGNDTTSSYSILDVEVKKDTLKVMLSVELKDLLDGAGEVRSLIKANALYATATFHIDQEKEVGDKTGYDVEFDINVKKNNAATVMEKDTLEAMLDMVRFFSPDFDIEKQIQEFGVILYDQMHSLNDSLGGGEKHTLFKFTDSGLELTDFYTFLALKMEPELLDDYTNEDIRETVQGLYDYDATENDNNFKVSNIMFNPPSEKGRRKWTNDEIKGDLLTGEGGLYGNTHVDIDFNGFLKEGVEKIAKDGEVTVEQTMILAKGDNRDNVKAVRDWLNNKLNLGDSEKVTAASDYLAITFSMSMTSYVGDEGGEENDAKSLFPKKIYATVVYKYDENAGEGEDKFTVVGGISDVAPVLVFNNMDTKQYNIMVKLMGANPNDEDTGATDERKVNMKTIAKKGAEVLNDMSYYEYNGYTAETTITFSYTASTDCIDGMGKIYISKPNIGGLPSGN